MRSDNIRSSMVNTVEVEEERQTWSGMHHRADVEETGASRVDETSRYTDLHLSTRKVFQFWFGYNFNSFNIIIGMIGPVGYNLSAERALVTGLLAITLGSIPVGLVSCLGPQSGLRTMVINRFVFGWYPAKALSLLCTTLLVGFAELDIIASGNIISALTPGSKLAPVLAVIVLGCLAIAIACFGIAVLQSCEQWIWLPQLLAVASLAGAFIPRTPRTPSDESSHPAADSFAATVGFFSFVFSVVIGYSVTAADYWVFYPSTTSQKRLFAGTVGGLWCSSVVLAGFGIALGKATRENVRWKAAYEQGPGEVLRVISAPLGLVGTLDCISFALGNEAAAAGGLYSQALAVQSLGGPLARQSRARLSAICGALGLTVAVAGRDSLVELLQNFVAVVGYWVSVWLTILGCDQLIFEKIRPSWSEWDHPSSMPKGYAASVAFVAGVGIAVLSMAETWYVGPIAKVGGDDGINVTLTSYSTRIMLTCA